MMARVKAVKAKNNTIIVYARTRARKKGREEERRKRRRSASHSRSLPLNRLTLNYEGGAFHDFPLHLIYLRGSFFFL